MRFPVQAGYESVRSSELRLSEIFGKPEMVRELLREAVPASDRTSDHGIINFHTAGRLRCVISDILHKLGYHYEVSVIPDLDLFY